MGGDTRAKNEERPSARTGLRICGSRGHPVVRRALIRYARWLRGQVEFPLRVPVYLLPGPDYLTLDGKRSVSGIFLPWDRHQEPHIRIATGDYREERRSQRRDDLLASYIHALSTEVICYRKWVETGEMIRRGNKVRANGLLRAYADTVAHP